MSTGPILQPANVPEVVAAVRGAKGVLPVGSGTKPALSAAPAGFTPMSLLALSGVVEYEPAEFTFTAKAGTRLSEVASVLSANGQYLPFDPPFVDDGATLGGAIASGLNGPGKHRFGGLRDFIIGVRFVTGEGELVRGGGKVVKNAAGFDFPKLMVGSLGRLGVLVEASFKVFPRPRGTATFRASCGDLAGALGAVERLNKAPFDVEALEFDAAGTVWVRLGGDAESFPARFANLRALLGIDGEALSGPDEEAFWRGMQPTAPAGALLAKVPVTPAAIPGLDRLAASAGASRRYSGGASQAWIGWPGSAASLDAALRERNLTGLVIAGPAPGPILGLPRSEAFLGRVRTALDPNGRFPSFR
jgi:glycolate oxidase FAD binding subunit